MGQFGSWEHGTQVHLIVSWENPILAVTLVHNKTFSGKTVGIFPHEKQEVGCFIKE